MAGARFIQFEVVGKDQKALQSFYGKLFDWSFDTNNPTAYGMTDPAVTGVTVGVGPSQDGSTGHVTGYVGVPDVDAALARAAELGGQTIMPKVSPAPGVNIALFADPEGHVIGLTEM
jgi:hypothetical protein